MNEFAEKILSECDWSEVSSILSDITSETLPKIKCIIPKLLKHKSWVVRCDVLDIIGEFELAEYGQAVSRILNDNNEHEIVRSYAMNAYYDLHKERAVKVLKKFTESKSIRLRLSALTLIYIETLSQETLDNIRKIVTRKNCNYHHQFVAILTFKYYLDLESWPDVIDLLKQIKKVTISKGVKGTIDNLLKKR